MQRDDKFEDWSRTSEEVAPKLYRMYNKQKIIVPPNYDLWIQFEPYGAGSGEISPAGAVRMRTWYYEDLTDMQQLITDLEADPNFRWGYDDGETEESVAQKFADAGVVTSLWASEEEEQEGTVDTCASESTSQPDAGESTTETTEESDEECDQGEAIESSCTNSQDGSCTTTETGWTNWDGEQVEAGAWYNKTLFSVWGIDVTAVEAIAVSGGLLVLIIISAVLCMYCSWRKRDAIKEGVRRASTFVGRGASHIRKSIVGRDEWVDVEAAELNPADLTTDTTQRNFLAAMFQYHREADDETRKTMKGRRMSSWAATKNMSGIRGGRKSVY